MTDLEMIKRCAEKMGYSWDEQHQGRRLSLWLDRESRNIASEPTGDYSPLTNDAQAMALVKKFGIRIGRNDDAWMALTCNENSTVSTDLNRAIVECVAKLN